MRARQGSPRDIAGSKIRGATSAVVSAPKSMPRQPAGASLTSTVAVVEGRVVPHWLNNQVLGRDRRLLQSASACLGGCVRRQGRSVDSLQRASGTTRTSRQRNAGTGQGEALDRVGHINIPYHEREAVAVATGRRAATLCEVFAIRGEEQFTTEGTESLFSV